MYCQKVKQISDLWIQATIKHCSCMNCHMQRLTKLFVSFTHCVWQFAEEKHLSNVAKMMHTVSRLNPHNFTSVQLLLLSTELQESLL